MYKYKSLQAGQLPQEQNLLFEKKFLRTSHWIQPKSFSMIQSAGIKNWVAQLIKRL